MLRGAIFCALAFVGAANAASWRVPLQHHRLSATQASLALQSARGAWGRSIPSTANHERVWSPSFPTSREREEADGDADFPNIGYGLYAAELAIGSPPQQVSLMVGLSASDVIMLDYKLGEHEFYDHNKSSTYRANGTQVTFNEGTQFEMKGFVSADHVAVPVSGGSQLQVQGQSFVEISSADHVFGMLPSSIDGTLGLGPHTAVGTGKLAFVRTMISQRVIDRPVVGVQYDDKDAHITFGGIDSKYKESDITYFPDSRTEDVGWWLPFNGVSVNGKKVLDTTARAMVFEGMAFIGGPREEVNALAVAVGAKNHVLPCDGPGPDVTLQFGSLAVTLKKKDYTVEQVPGHCVFGFLPLPPAIPYWLLGAVFTHRTYLVLDYGSSQGEERLGVALLK